MAIDDNSCTQCFDHAATININVIVVSLHTKSQLRNSFTLLYSRYNIFVLIEEFLSVWNGFEVHFKHKIRLKHFELVASTYFSRG